MDLVSPLFLLKGPTLLKLKLVGFWFNMNIMSLTPSLSCNLIPARGELSKPNRVLHGLSNQQMGNKLQRGDLNLGPPAKLGSDTMLNDQLS